MSTPQNLDTLQLPVELTRRPAPRRAGVWQALVILGLLVVAAESLWLSRDFWLRQPGVRNFLAPRLDVFGYALERPYLPDAWRVSALTLRPEPSAPGVWHVEALVQHDADIFQHWPPLVLELRDWQGRLAGRRELQPADYLPAGLPASLDARALIAGGQPVRIHAALRFPVSSAGGTPAFEQVELRPRR
ncbi:MAG: DUF3426 domain-containing protein [Perlucidibaca sp.]